MAILTISTVSPALCEKPQSYVACENDFAATAIQTAARVYLAKKQWEYLYVRHIENEILRLQDASRSKRQRARKRKILDQTATVIQTLTRGYLVRKRYRESDKMLRNNATRGLSLMESVRKRMDIRQKIEALKQQLSEVREARNTHSDDDDENDDQEESSNNNSQQYTDEVSVRKVEELKAIQHKLNIKAKTLEAVTRPLQEKFDGLRAEHEKLMKKYGKIESKNESRKYSNETKAELLAQKQKLLQETRDELAFTEDGVTLERSKAQQRLDTLVETSSAYASLGMNERDAAAFADEVSRIGKEAHRKAKLFRDSLRMASNLTKSWSSRSLTSNTVDTNAAVATNSNKPMPSITTTKPTMKKTDSTSSLSDNGGHRPVKRGHGRVLRNLLRDRSASSESEQNRSLSPTLKRQDSSFSSISSSDEQQPQSSKMLRKGQRYFIKRDKGRSLSPQRHKESVFVKRGSSRRLLDRDKSRTPSPQRRGAESTFVKRTRTPSPTNKASSANNTPVISNKMKFKGSSNSTTPKLSDKAKVGSTTITPKTTNVSNMLKSTPKMSNTHTPKMSNKQTPRTTNVSKPMRRTFSEANTPISEMRRGLRKVLSERSMMLSNDVPSSSRIHKLKEELREECTKGGRKSRSKSRDRKNSAEPKRLKSKKKSINQKTKSKSPNRKTKSKSPSHSASPKGNNGRSVVGRTNSNSPRSNNRSVQFSESGGLLRGKRPTHNNNHNDADTPEQPRRHVSLTAPKIDVRRNKRTYLRRTISLTESSKNRRKFVDECIDSGGMMPNLA